MRYKTIIFTLLGVLTAVFIFVRYGLFIVYWFTTPNALERTEAEKQLIEHLKGVFKTNEITISPEYDLEKDTTYIVIYRGYSLRRYFIFQRKSHLHKKQIG